MDREQRRFTNVLIAFLQSIWFMEQNYREHQNEITAAPGTCEWLLRHDHFQTWLHKHTGLLWLLGGPGVGKSTLMKYAVQRSRQASENAAVVAAFFIHGRGNEMQHSPLGLYRSVLHQILPHFPHHLAQLATIFEDYEKAKGAYGKAWTWSEAELRKFFADVILKASSERQVILFVDALDEMRVGKETGSAYQERVQSLIEELKHLVHSSGDGIKALKICVSCRYYPVLFDDNGVSIPVERGNEEDINTLVRDHQALNALNQADRELLEDSITKRAKGVFQWVSIVLMKVTHFRKKGRSVKAIEKEISKVPSTLQGLYESIILAGDEEDRKQTLKLFHWTMSAIRPLSLPEIRDCLAIDGEDNCTSYADLTESDNFHDINDMQAVVHDLSKGLIRAQTLERFRGHDPVFGEDFTRYVASEDASTIGFYTEPNSTFKRDGQLATVQFVHQSVLDYLQDGGIRKLAGSIDGLAATSADIQISRSCIKYLHLEEIRPCSPPDFAKYPLAEYSNYYWTFHVMQAEEQGLDQKDLLNHFNWRDDKSGLPKSFILAKANVVMNDPVLMTKDKLEPFFRDLASVARPIAEKNEQFNHALECWDFCSDRSLTNILRQAILHNPPHTTLVNLCSAAGIRSALQEMRNLQPGLYEEERGGDVLFYALLGGHEQIIQDVIKVLCAHHVAPQSKSNTTEYSSLGLATLMGRQDLILAFLDAGAKVDHLHMNQRQERFSALYLAASKGQTSIVRQLLNAHADVRLWSLRHTPERVEEVTALHVAAENGHMEVVRLLLEHEQIDANSNGSRLVDVKNSLNETALHAVLEIVKANDDRTSGWSNVPSEEQAQKDLQGYWQSPGGKERRTRAKPWARPNSVQNRLRDSQFFQKHGVDWSPMAKEASMLELLLQFGAQPMLPNSRGITPMELSLRFVHSVDTTKVLLKWKDRHGRTALMRQALACTDEWQSLKVLQLVRLALRMHQNLSAQDNSGNSLFSIAMDLGFTELMDTLSAARRVNLA